MLFFRWRIGISRNHYDERVEHLRAQFPQSEAMGLSGCGNKALAIVLGDHDAMIYNTEGKNKKIRHLFFSFFHSIKKKFKFFTFKIKIFI